MLNGQHGHNAAAHIHKGPETLQPGHPAGEDSSRLQTLQEIVHSPLLGRPAGEKCRRRALFVGLQGRDSKTGGLSHPGENGDVPVCAADPGGHGLLPWNTALNAPEIQAKGVVHAAALDRGLQDSPRL